MINANPKSDKYKKDCAIRADAPHSKVFPTSSATLCDWPDPLATSQITEYTFHFPPLPPSKIQRFVTDS
jgi:hypothetical protein